jgi:hypothetical protein
VRTAQFPSPLAVVTRQQQGLDGDVAFDAGQEGTLARANADTARVRRFELLQHPLTLMWEGLQSGAWVANPRTVDGETRIDLTSRSGELVTVGFDPETRLPVRVTFPWQDPIWGDVVLEARFSDYRDADGLQVPGRIVTMQDEWTRTDRRIGRTTINAGAERLAAPDAVRAAPVPTEPPVTVTVTEVRPHVFWLTGGTHHSVLFDFADRMTLFELPQGDARAKAVIDAARALRPGKLLRDVIVSHHHLDHAGGIRTAVAEGLIIITPISNVPFYERLVARPHTRRPDTLARNPRKSQFWGLEHFSYGGWGGLYPNIRFFKAQGNVHSERLLFGWEHKNRILMQADLYDVNWSWHPWGDNFLENVKAQGLEPLLHVPIHGSMQTHAEVLKTLASKPKGPPVTE